MKIYTQRFLHNGAQRKLGKKRRRMPVAWQGVVFRYWTLNSGELWRRSRLKNGFEGIGKITLELIVPWLDSYTFLLSNTCS